MRKNEPVSHLMTRDPVTLHLGQKPSEMQTIFAASRFHHLPVVDGERLIGMLSTSDAVRFFTDAWGTNNRQLADAIDNDFNLEEIMVRSPITLSEDASIRDAVHLLSAGEYHALPVTDGDGNLKGIVTSTDLIRYLGDQLA
jgi:CBS domain-containing protein